MTFAKLMEAELAAANRYADRQDAIAATMVYCPTEGEIQRAYAELHKVIRASGEPYVIAPGVQRRRRK